MHACSVDVVVCATWVAGMLSSPEIVLLSVLESEIGRVFCGCRVKLSSLSLLSLPFGGNSSRIISS